MLLIMKIMMIRSSVYKCAWLRVQIIPDRNCSFTQIFLYNSLPNVYKGYLVNQGQPTRPVLRKPVLKCQPGIQFSLRTGQLNHVLEQLYLLGVSKLFQNRSIFQNIAPLFLEQVHFARKNVNFLEQLILSGYTNIVQNRSI